MTTCRLPPDCTAVLHLATPARAYCANGCGSSHLLLSVSASLPCLAQHSAACRPVQLITRWVPAQRSPVLQSKIRCAEALAQLQDKRYKQAARKLTEVRWVEGFRALWHLLHLCQLHSQLWKDGRYKQAARKLTWVRRVWSPGLGPQCC